MSRKSIILALSFVALVAIALAACTPTEVVKTVIVTQEVQVAGTPVVQEVVVTATPPPAVVTEAAPRTLVVCMGQEPDTLFIYGGTMLAASSVDELIYDGPYTNLTFAYQPVILEKLPSIKDGDAALAAIDVKAGDTVVADDGNPATLTAKTATTAGTKVRPAGCRSSDCAVEYDGTNVTQMDQLSATFKFLPGLTWSDGTPLKASDSVYSFNLNGSPDVPAGTRYLIDRSASYTATDDQTVVWTGLPGYLDATYYINVAQPLPEHIMGQYTPADLVTQFDAQKLWLGWGPFIIDEWTKGEQITAHKNPNYFRASEGLPYLDNVVFRFTGGDPNASIAAILAGECDIVDQTTALEGQSQLLLQLQAKKQLNPTFVTGTTWEHADFNIEPISDIVNKGNFAGWVASGQTDGPFGDVRLRQAIAQCMDRQSVVDTVLYGQSVVLNTYLPPNHPLFNADAKAWPYDPKAAAALLDEIGWKDTDNDPATPRVAVNVPGVPANTPLEFNYQTTTTAFRQQVTQILAQNLAGCGIKADLGYLTATQWFAAAPDGPLNGRRYDLGEFAWLTGVQPPCDLYLSTQIPTPENGWAGQNNTGFKNADYDKACNTQLQSLPDDPGYAQGAKDAQALFAENLPVVPLLLRLKLAATRPDMCNFIMDPTQNSEFWNIEKFDFAGGPGCTK